MGAGGAALERSVAEAAFTDAITACDPAARVAGALAEPELAGWLGDRRHGLAIGKAALAMARGAGPVERGLVVSPVGGEVPAGWRLVIAAHPEPDERSVRAGQAAVALVEGARAPARDPRARSPAARPRSSSCRRGTLDELRQTIRALMAAGAPIAELNAVRGALSAIKDGELAARAAVPIATLAVSDVIGDDLAVIGSGPTWLPPGTLDLGARRRARLARARAILAGHGLAIPALLDGEVAAQVVTRADRGALVAPMSAFAEAARVALAARGVEARLLPTPVAGEVAQVAEALAAEAGPVIGWGEPTVRLPAAPGEGGRAQQLALELARRLRGTARRALVVGSDGSDGPPSRARPTPAGAFVDGTTWDAIGRAGIDPDAALAGRDAGPALAAAGALVITGPTGINHADLIVLA